MSQSLTPTWDRMTPEERERFAERTARENKYLDRMLAEVREIQRRDRVARERAEQERKAR